MYFGIINDQLSSSLITTKESLLKYFLLNTSMKTISDFNITVEVLNTLSNTARILYHFYTYQRIINLK